MRDYDEFLRQKHFAAPVVGFECGELNPLLFPFQRDLVRWALRRGRAALFCDTGLGKAFQSLEWAHRVCEHTGGRVLILAPLAVARQTVREGKKFNVVAEYARKQSDSECPIVVANYEMLEHFDVSAFVGVVCDESGILKSFDGATRNIIIEAFGRTPYKLACTATPAPNDFMELGNHSEFLGVLSRPEMLSTYFVHDGGDTQSWRLKGHAQDPFWRWVCSWAAMVRKPSDLGYPNDGYDLPPLRMHQHTVPVDHVDARKVGDLFVMEARTLDEQRKARRMSLDARVQNCADLINASDRPWLVWCALNDEGDALEVALKDAVQVAGADEREVKEDRLIGFAEGRHRILITKSRVAGYGMNFQHCSDMAFVGMDNSWEQFYQSIRRCYRFGQPREVNVHVFTSEAEGAVIKNLERKEVDAQRMAAEMGDRMRESMRLEVQGARRELVRYVPEKSMRVPAWLTTEGL